MMLTNCGRRLGLFVLPAVLAGGFLAPAARAVPGTDAFRIVTPDWVAEHAGEPGLRILVVRTSVAAYQHGHVEGAVFLANDALRVPAAGVPVQYLDPEPMAAVFRRAGVRESDSVLVYADGDDVLGATMAAYCLHRIGHRDVMILDGGLEAYRQKYPLTQAYPDAPSGDVAARPDPSIYVTLEQLRPLIGAPGVTILDTRPATDYLGNTSRWMRNGHIPGAVNLDWHQLMEPGNPHRFKAAADLRRLIETTGVQPDDDVIVYCGTSREATLVYQVMKQVLGYPRVRLYEGSWTEYCSIPSLPVERMPAATGSMLSSAGRPAATPAAHVPPVTETLEPYTCGTVQRLHTIQGIFLASQPQPEDFEQAAKGGIKTVINQRHEAEVKDFNERQIVTGLGMAYCNPAFNGPAELTDEILDATRELLRTAERPVLIHCSSANRTGAAWLAYSVLDRGLSWDAALAEARTVGLRSPDYERIVKAYVERQQRSSQHAAAPSPNPPPNSSLDSRTRDALLAALDDERRARAYYTAVMSKYGHVRPFANVVEAESRHEGLVLSLLDRYDIEAPADRWAGATMDVPDTFADACRLAVRYEEENIAMYDRFLAFLSEPEVRQAMEVLRDASASRHLPAFRRQAGVP